MKTITGLLILTLLTGAVAADGLDSDKRISLDLNDMPLPKVLQMIATQGNLNIVLPEDVAGSISVRLDKVELRTALDAILTANGYSYTLRDNVIIVRKTDETEPEQLVSRVVLLNYIDPATAQRVLEARKSAKGQIVILDKSPAPGGSIGSAQLYQPNRLVITDYPALVDDLVALVSSLDVPERVVLIEAKILETTRDDQSRLGLLWPTSVNVSLSDAPTAVTPDEDNTQTSQQRNALFKDLKAGDWQWGTLNVAQMQTVLDLLEQDGHTKLISDPRITTVENTEAEISIATIVPIQTINRFSEGGAVQDIVTFQDEEIGISLKVTPRINNDSMLTLDVAPRVEDIIGYSGPINNQKPITASRSLKTRVTVKDGETVVLGGLLKEDERITTQRVPLLGRIPLLGKTLFTNQSKQKTQSDLIIMITPHIIRNR